MTKKFQSGLGRSIGFIPGLGQVRDWVYTLKRGGDGKTENFGSGPLQKHRARAGTGWITGPDYMVLAKLIEVRYCCSIVA